MNLSKKEILFILLMIAISCLMATLLYPKFAKIGTDGALYATLGKNFIQGDGLTLYGHPHTIFSPLFPIFIGIFFFFINNLELAAHITTIFFALISLPFFYFLVKKLYSKREAVVALLFFTFNGYVVWHYSVVPTPQILASFLSIITFIALLKIFYIKDRFTGANFFWLFSAGLLIGMSYLTRPEYFFVIFPALLYLFIIYRKVFSLKRVCLLLLTIIVGFSIASFPYILFLHSNLGHWTISGRINELALIVSAQDAQDYENINNPIGHELNTSVILPPKIERHILDLIVENFKTITKRSLKNLLSVERALIIIFGIIGTAFLSYGLREFILKKRFKELGIFAISFTTLLIVAVLHRGSPNYLIQFFYLFTIFIAVGFWAFYDEIVSRFKMGCSKVRIVFVGLTIVATLYFFFPLIQQCLFLPKDYKPEEFKLMGLWIKENIPGIKNETILARKPDVAFYADARWQIVPNSENLCDLLELMQNNHVNYLIVDDRFFRETRPQFVDLFNSSNDFDGLELIKTVIFNKKQVLLYRLSKQNNKIR